MFQYLLVVALLGLAGCTSIHDSSYPTADVPPLKDDLSGFTEPIRLPLPKPAPVPVPPARRPAAPNELLYPYEEGRDYYVEVPLGFPVDLVLEPGEALLNVVGGDRTPEEDATLAVGVVGSQADSMPAQSGRAWQLRDGQSGQGAAAQPHVFLTVTKPGLTIGLVFTTSLRTYYVTAKSVKTSGIRSVRWDYPAKPVLPPEPVPTIWPNPREPHMLHTGYLVESARTPDWLPQAYNVVDDGQRTYIILPPATRFSRTPLVRMIGATGQPEVITSRQYATVIVLDELIQRVELRIGTGEQAEIATITRGTLHTIHCPGDPYCPQWPRLER